MTNWRQTLKTRRRIPLKKSLNSAIKNLAVFSSVIICVVCVVIKIKNVSLQEGTDLLFYSAGVGTKQDGTAQKSKEINKEKINNEGDFQMIEEGDAALYHEIALPKTEQTPDPSRETLAVEEIKSQGGAQVSNFFVNDKTSSGTDILAELGIDPAIDLKFNGEPEVLLYHTHTSEAYLDSFTGFYYTDMNTRTQNQEMSVVAVGEAIKEKLEQAGIGVIHDKTVNDLRYNGSYARSWEVLQNNLAEHPTIQVTIDIHRDSMTTEAGVKYKPTAEIDGRKAAQVMILAGCDADGSWGDFPDWKENLHLALRLQQKATEKYPELMRPMLFSNSKYNMNATKGSMLIEVGTEVNTAAEARYSGSLIGEALAETLLEGKN